MVLPLAKQTCWVVGGVGVVGRGIAKSLLRAGATVIVNSRSSERLRRFAVDIEDESAGLTNRLITVRGSLLPGYAKKTVEETLGAMPLNHVVAHGALRLDPGKNYADESHLLATSSPGGLLGLDPTSEFVPAASQLTSLHYSAASTLIPRVQFACSSSQRPGTYTFVTGKGSHPTKRAPPMAEINEYQMWGLASALRHQEFEFVNLRELRVQLGVNRPAEVRDQYPRRVPLSVQVGNICAGLVSRPEEDSGQLLEVTDDLALASLSTKYPATASSSEETGHVAA